jgi:pyridinium-3,5-bisthiocarboxylic acid mononucleotide nickel chelatase
MKLVFFDCSSGASGDMIVSGLIDAGVPVEIVRDAVASVQVAVHVAASGVTKGALRATSFAATAEEQGANRDYSDIRALLEGSTLIPPVKRRALEAFALLADAEAKIHDQEIDHVHFHEVGGADAIADIVGACAALEHLAPDRIVVSPIATGRGTTDSMHGTIPVPAPAVLEILTGAELFERGADELITPTGAALLASWADAFGAMPRNKLTAVGYGAGSKELAWPNVLRVVVGEAADEPHSSVDTELLETNIDDMSPELIPFVIERVLDAGALDAWSTPVQMKKGRIGVVLSVLVERGATQPVLDVIFRETTTFGVRISEIDRAVLDRKIVDVEVAGHRVRVKVGYRDGEPVTSSPEYEDAAEVARATGMPLRDVYRAALEELEL